MKTKKNIFLCIALAIISLIAFEDTAAAATAITQGIEEISYTQATINGAITSPLYVTAYGVCWNTTGGPTLADNCTDEGVTNTGVYFSSEISGLSPASTYFVRAYATEWYGAIAYGNVLEFTTKDLLPTVTTQAVTDIKTKSAMGHGTIVDLGITNPTQHGVCWNTRGTPTLDDKKTEEGAVAEIGLFTSEIKGLRSNRTYYVRAYATNSKGTSYGNVVKFTTSLSPPIVTTQTVTDIGATEATANGIVTDVGSPDPFQHGFCWNTTGMPDLEDKKTEQGAVNETGSFSSIITALLPQTTYYVRAYATNTTGTAFGDEVSFTTLSALPTVVTEAVTDIGTISATGHGTILDLGVPNPHQHGVCWNTSGNPGLEDNKTEEGPPSGIGEFSSLIAELLPDTTYYVRAYASNDSGTGFGDDVSFTTHPMLPLVSTDAVSDIATHAAIVHGTILDPGVPNPYQHGVCWNTSGNPALEDSKTEEGPVSDTGEFSSVIEGLLPDTTYYVRAYASNPAGTSYGNVVPFTTVSSLLAPTATVTDIPSKVTSATSYTIHVGGIGVVGYRYRLDDDDWSNERPVGDAIAFNLFAEGAHTLSVVGKNTAEMWQALDNPTTIAWSIDTTPPVAELTNYPAGICNASGAQVSVGGFGVVSYRYRLDGGEWSGIFPVNTSISLSDLSLSAGAHFLEVIGADHAGNWQDENNATNTSWTNDPTIPTAVLNNIPGNVTNQTTTNITVTFPDNGIPIDAYTYTTDDGHTWWENDAHEAIDLTGLSEGPHTLCVHAFGDGIWQDGLNGMSSTVNATCIQWRVDLTPANPAVLSIETNPSAAAFAPGMPGTVSVQLSWKWSSDDALETLQRYRVWYSEEQLTDSGLDDAVEVFCELMPGIEGFEETYSISGLIPGRLYHFGVKSIDNAGNLSNLSNIAAWTPEDRLPQITALALTEGGTSTDNATTREIGITGNNFLETAGCNRVRFESAPYVVDVVGKSGTTQEISADIPVGLPPGVYRVRVINRNGISQASSKTITITASETPVPAVTGIHPLIAEVGTQTVLTIHGENFDQEVAVVNLLAADGTQTPLSNVIRHDSQTITAVIDVAQSFPEGSYHVQVIHSNGLFNEVSAVKVELCLPLQLQDKTGAVTTAKIITIGNSAIPAATLLTSDDRNEVSPVSTHRSKIKLFIEPGSAFEMGDQSQTAWTDYTGPIRPPRQIHPREPVVDTLGTEAVSFSIGIDDALRLQNGRTMFVLLEATMPSHVETPSVYHVSSEGDLSLAGVDGEWRGLVLSKGGTVLAKRLNIPEDGLTTYTIGLLLTSMSDYAIGTSLFEIPDDTLGSTIDSYGFCFIQALSAENIFKTLWSIIFSAAGLAFFIYFKGIRR